MNPVVGFIDGRIIVAGGWTALCPPNAACVAPSDPPLSDGGAYDLATGRWSRIADAPVGFGPAVSAVIGCDLYVLVCDPGRGCRADHSLLRYRSRADAWDALPGPGDDTHRELMVFDGRLIAYAPSDEGGEVADQMLTPGEDHWVPLPDDPLPTVYDRQLVEHDSRLVVFGSPIEFDHATKLAAAYDPTTSIWTRLHGSGTLGYQVWRSGSLLYLNPHFGPGAEGGVYDPAVDEWTPLPDPPAAESWHNDMAGVVSSDHATYVYPHGWVLSTHSGHWIEIHHDRRPSRNPAADRAGCWSSTRRRGRPELVRRRAPGRRDVGVDTTAGCVGHPPAVTDYPAPNVNTAWLTPTTNTDRDSHSATMSAVSTVVTPGAHQRNGQERCARLQSLTVGTKPQVRATFTGRGAAWLARLLWD